MENNSFNQSKGSKFNEVKAKVVSHLTKHKDRYIVGVTCMLVGFSIGRRIAGSKKTKRPDKISFHIVDLSSEEASQEIADHLKGEIDKIRFSKYTEF